MLGFLWKKKVRGPTKEQLRQAKALGVKSAAQMSRASLEVVIEEGKKKRAEERKNKR